MKVDSYDYDLLGLQWRATYVDMCLPFGKHQGSQIFQHISDAVHFVMRKEGFGAIDYIDGYIWIGDSDIFC